MPSRLTVIFGTVLTLSATCFFGIHLKDLLEKNGKLQALREQEQLCLQQAEELFNKGLLDEALKIVLTFEASQDSLDLLVKIYTQKNDKKTLASIFEYSKDPFLQNEKALLLAAQYTLENHLIDQYTVLRNFSRGFEENETAWFFLDADALALKGKKQEASLFLSSQTLKGEEEISRLLRLSMLFTEEDPKKSLKILTEASKKDPKNPLIASSKAHLLEKMGSLDAARSEYELALKLSQNGFEEDQEYIAFLLRQKEFAKAVPRIFSNLNPYSPKEFWYKALFLNKVTTETTPLQNLEAISKDPYANYLISLKKEELWNKKKFLELENSDEILRKEPTAFWLRLLSALKQENFKEAWIILQTPPKTLDDEGVSLAKAFKDLLAFRGFGTATYEEISTLLTTKDFTEAQGLKTLLQHLAKSSLPGESPIETTDELDLFLDSQEVIAAVLLNEGWYEAAIQIYPFEKTTEEAPSFVIEKMITAIETNRNSAKALEFAAYHHPKYPLFDQAKAVLARAQDSERDLDKIKLLLKENSEESLLTSKFLIDLYLNDKDYAKAKKVIEENPKLYAMPLGKEMLARISLKEGNDAKAHELYQAILKESVEAKSFLAKKAFKEKNWKIAHQLTLELLKEYPDNKTLLENLQAINTYR
jgi:hypothetical protein